MSDNNQINYVEFAARDLTATKDFFQAAFGWVFTDFGPEYCAFSNSGLQGGFYKAPLTSEQDKGGALIVLFSDQLEKTLAKVKSLGGLVTKEIFEFPGGRRFHFIEPSGNEFAVWTTV